MNVIVIQLVAKGLPLKTTFCWVVLIVKIRILLCIIELLGFGIKVF